MTNLYLNNETGHFEEYGKYDVVIHCKNAYESEEIRGYINRAISNEAKIDDFRTALQSYINKTKEKLGQEAQTTEEMILTIFKEIFEMD